MDVNHDSRRLVRALLDTGLSFSGKLIPVESRDVDAVTHGQEFTIPLLNVLYIGKLIEVNIKQVDWGLINIKHYLSVLLVLARMVHVDSITSI